MTSTSAYLAACADATQPLMRTVFFFLSATVAIITPPSLSRRLRCHGNATRSHENTKKKRLVLPSHRLRYHEMQLRSQTPRRIDERWFSSCLRVFMVAFVLMPHRSNLLGGLFGHPP